MQADLTTTSSSSSEHSQEKCVSDYCFVGKGSLEILIIMFGFNGQAFIQRFELDSLLLHKASCDH